MSHIPYHYCLGMYKGEIIEISICNRHAGGSYEMTKEEFMKYKGKEKKK